MGQPDDMRALAERFRALLSGERGPSAAEIFSKDLYFRGSLRREARGLEGFADYMDLVAAAFGEFRCEVEDLVAEDEQAFARVRFSGRHKGQFLGFPPTGKRVEYTGAAHLKTRGGKIHYAWVIGDLDELRENLEANAS